jgi:hypothetical protein
MNQKWMKRKKKLQFRMQVKVKRKPNTQLKQEEKKKTLNFIKSSKIIFFQNPL